MQKLIKRTILAAATVALLGVGAAQAATQYVSAQLTGDPRTANPDNLIINVLIAFEDSNDNTALWTIDIASPLHPNAKLGEFYFNMVGAASGYSFSGFNPAGWTITSPATTTGGGNFNPTFLFEANDPPGSGNDVTNSQNLSFIMTRASGFFSIADFLNSSPVCSTETVLGCGQLGAHLQSLTIAGTSATTDSGFLLGSYQEGQRPPDEVPIPAAAWLLGSGLMAMGAIGRRRKKSIA